MSCFRPGAWLLALALLLSAAPVWAVGRVIPSTGGTVKVDELRVAAALSPDQTTLWSAFRLSGSAQRAAVVMPVPPGSFVDPGSEAWFRALENATAPRVLPPRNMPVCVGGSSNQIDNTARAAPATTLRPVQVAVLDTLPDLDDYAAKNQLALSPADRAALDAPGQRLLAVLYALAPGSSTFTQTLRITEPGEVSSLSLGLARQSGAAPIPFTLWMIASGRSSIAPGTELAPSDVKAVWHAFDGDSDYLKRRKDLLASAAGASFIRESSGNSRLFGWTVLPGQKGSVPPASDGYFEIASQLGDTTSDPADCSQAASQARVLGSQGEAVGDACAPGLLARVPLDGGADPTCTEQPTADSVDPGTLRCGAADDFAMALSGLRADQAGLTRLEGLLGSNSSQSSSIEQLPADARSPGVVASSADNSGCHSQSGGGNNGSGGYGGGGYGAYGGFSGGSYGGYSGGSYGGYSGSGGYAGYSGGGGYSSYSGSGSTNVDMSCSSSSGDSCSGDSSSSSSSSCSGNSSSSSDGATCGGDSSGNTSSCSGNSSSSSDGATCSGNSSSGDGATCSGSSSSGDGATCSGSSSGSGSSCALSPGRHAHLSVWSIVLAALLLPSRRVSRRRRPKRSRRRRRVVSAGRR